MKPNISEFSYGYALTDELIHRHGVALTAAPVFPSLYQEGQAGGGYDLMLQRPGLPLFLQFKLGDCMVRANAQEIRDGHFTAPFYRMHLRPSRHSDQHEMLLDLENSGSEVYYCAPAFHTPEELNDAYLNQQVRARSLWLRPSDIGPLPDNEDHHVAFTVPGVHRFCSKNSRPIESKGDFQVFFENIDKIFKEKSSWSLNRENLSKIASDIKNIAQKRRDISYEAKETTARQLETRHPLEQIAVYSHVFLDCQLFLVREIEVDDNA